MQSEKKTNGNAIGYEVKGFQMLPVRALRPGDAAASMVADDDDRDAVNASVSDIGILQPLIVRQCDDGAYEVLDGVGRLRAAVLAEIESLPCVIVECADDKRMAMHVNTMGRKRSTGSRVLSYVEANWGQVCAAKKAVASLHTTGVSRDTPVDADLERWTVAQISKRLGVSNKDVSYAIELAQCHRDVVYPDICVHGRYGEHKAIEDSDDEAALSKAYSGVLTGRLPIRRWAAAFAGRVNSQGGGKAATNYSVLARRSAISLLSCLEQWASIKWESPRVREDTEKALAAMMANLPEVCRETLIGLIPATWPKGETANLRRALGGK